MILKASQRGGANKLAAHLLNSQDNEHIEIYEVRGFISDTLTGALQETYAMSKGTKCKQFLFSVNLNPPKDQSVPIDVFQNAIERIEKTMMLEGQARAIIFHEKNGRRHAHAVWSRIDAEKMKAINLPFFKNKMMEISKEIYLEQGWKLPEGFIDREKRNPLNFTLAEWQQAKRLGENAKTIKQTLKECWAISDSKKAFQQALEHKGYYLAKGDRRGFVALDWRGEPYSLSRWLDLKTRAISERLGKPDELPSVEETRKAIDTKLVERINTYTSKIHQKFDKRLAPLTTYQAKMTQRHKAEREELKQRQSERRNREAKEHHARFNKGLHGLWDRFTGKHARIEEQNQLDAYQASIRDQKERDNLIWQHLQERGNLQKSIDEVHMQQDKEIEQFRDAILSNVSKEKISSLEVEFATSTQEHSQSHGPTM